MLKTIYSELLKIFISKTTGFRQEEETRFVIDNLMNFLKLKYIDYV